jgi:hypothetical protein
MTTFISHRYKHEALETRKDLEFKEKASMMDGCH